MSLVTSIAALIASLLGPYVTLLVARGQFKANVLSTNRQKWIDTFRDRLSELLSLIKAAQLMKRHAVHDWQGGSGPVREDPKLSEKFERAFMAVSQIHLLTKASEPSHCTLNAAIDKALGYLLQDDLRLLEMTAWIEEITQEGRGIIRHEWARVKRGD